MCWQSAPIRRRAAPGDALEYTAAAGAAALLIGPAAEAVAVIEGTTSYVTDTPDFFRRADTAYPVHGHRFTGEPAYFGASRGAAERLLHDLGAKPSDFTYAVFHQPNTRFPQTVARQLGFTPQQITPGLLSPKIGNAYSAAALLGLCAILDMAEPGDTIFCDDLRFRRRIRRLCAARNRCPAGAPRARAADGCVPRA